MMAAVVAVLKQNNHHKNKNGAQATRAHQICAIEKAARL
jgi:hypothetical protein